MKKIITLITLAMFLTSCSEIECTSNEDCRPKEMKLGTRYWCEDSKCHVEPLGNPASEYCLEQGGILQTITEEDGEYNNCILASGKVCEEWDYFKGNCP
ncbi:DUF333 domain-containing protein [Candidatus Woesearchaeota archaeon]|nr:DUF333 domain-containing protein [Candidatus Woesearchaeota archaeon]